MLTLSFLACSAIVLGALVGCGFAICFPGLRLILTAASGHQLDVQLTAGALGKAKRSRELGRAARNLPADDLRRTKMGQEVEAIFPWLRTAPDTEIVEAKNSASRP